MAKKPLTWTNETRRLADLIPWPDNPRFIADEQAQRLDDSFRQFGQVDPLAISPANELYNGHQRLKVLVDSYGPDYEIDVRVSSRPLTEAERKKLTVYLHRGATGEWDFEKLATWDLGNLLEWGFEADDLNFDDPAPAGTGDAEPQTDRAAELQEKWKTERGQLWAIGQHRLLCGDSTVRADVERVMGGERVDMVFTSPPYNRGTTTGHGFHDGGMSTQMTGGYDGYKDDLPGEKYREWQSGLLSSWWELLADNGAIFYNHRPRVQNGIYETALDWNPGLPIRQIVIWFSNGGINFAPTHYRGLHEWIVIFAKPGFRLIDRSHSTIGDVWELGVSLVDGHPAPFPVGIPTNALSTTPCQIIYDPFAGSGTTLVACQNLSRRGRAIEISPAYCAVILQRMIDAFPHLEIYQLP